MALDQTSREFLEDLYVRYSNSLFLYAYSVLQDREQAMDAVHDAFQIACQKADSIQRSPYPQAWLKRTLKYVISNLRQKQANSSVATSNFLSGNIDHTVTLSPEENDPDLSLYPISNTKEYRLVKANTLEGVSARELANANNISPEAGKKRVQRAKSFLKKKLF